MRKLLRFRLKSMLLLIAVVALAIGVIPRVQRWNHFRKMIDGLLSDPLSGHPVVSTPRDYMEKNRDYISERILKIGLEDREEGRRILAIRCLKCPNRLGKDQGFVRKWISRLTDLATDSSTSPNISQESASLLRDWIQKAPLTTAHRRSIFQRASVSQGAERLEWVNVLAEIGGREEIELLLAFGNADDPVLTKAVLVSELNQVHWKGLVPHLEQWLSQSENGLDALQFSVLSRSPEGRELLLQFVVDQKGSTKVRRQGLNTLAGNLAGIQLLQESCKNPTNRNAMSELLTVDAFLWLSQENENLQANRCSYFFDNLIGCLDVETNILYDSRVFAKWKPLERPNRERQAEIALDALHSLTGRSELKTLEDWQDWKGLGLPRIEQGAYLQYLTDHPEALNEFSMLRLVDPASLGSIPSECRTHYRSLLKSGDPSVRAFVAGAILDTEESDEAVNVFIELWASHLKDNGELHIGKSAVQRRYGVHFGNDLAAWQKWASELGKSH